MRFIDIVGEGEQQEEYVDMIQIRKNLIGNLNSKAVTGLLTKCTGDSYHPSNAKMNCLWPDNHNWCALAAIPQNEIRIDAMREINSMIKLDPCSSRDNRK